jgi:hypothetical protein
MTGLIEDRSQIRTGTGAQVAAGAARHYLTTLPGP